MNFERIKENKRLILIGFIALCLIIIASVFYTNVVSAARQYDKAVVAFENHEYDKAREIFLKLDDYKDSSERAETCRTSKLEYDLSRAIKYHDNEEYEKAIEILENMEDYNGSKELCEKCYALMEIRDSNRKLDPAYSAYYKIAKNKKNSFGKSKIAKDTLADIKGAYTVKGICLLKLIDLNGDGIEELFVGTRASASDGEGSYEIYAFINGSAQLVDDGEFKRYGNKSSFYGFEMYYDGKCYQLYKGDAENGKLKVFDGFKFENGMTWKHKGKKYFINDLKVSKEEYNSTVPIYYEENFFTSKNEPLYAYFFSADKIKVYATSSLTEGVAMNLVTDNNSVYTTLKDAYGRTKE